MNRTSIAPGDLARGVRHAADGCRLWAGNPRLMLLGAIPALLVGVVCIGLVWWTLASAYGWATALTPFVSTWHVLLRDLVRITLALAIDVAVLTLCLLAYASVTLVVGTPWYERIASETAALVGRPTTPVPQPWRAQVARTWQDVRASTAFALRTALLALVIGLVPVVGAAAAALVVTVRGAHLLALELTGFAGEPLGWSFRQRHAALQRRPLLALGTAFPHHLAFLVPGLAVVAMPAAVAAGTLLMLQLDEEQESEVSRVATDR